MEHQPSSRSVVLPTALFFGGLVFTLIFYAHLWRVPATRYAARDDAVITLSHARNLVEFGFIGTSPSGERVEGFSAPLQFWIAAALYYVAPFEYQTFFRWQTLIGTFALGMVFVAVLWSGTGSNDLRRRAVFVAISLVLTAEILANSSAFLWWHASGMENVHKSIGIMALLWAFDTMLRRGHIAWSAIWLVSLAAITRIDAIVPTAMLLGAFAALWVIRYRSVRAPVFAAAALLPWGLFMVWRWWYFGEVEPNTAAAQSISVLSRLTSVAHSPWGALLDDWEWFADVGTNLFAFQLLWLIPLGMRLRRQPIAVNRLVLVLTGTAACVTQYVLFGPARMDPSRTVTELALLATASVPFVLLAFETFPMEHLVLGLLMLGCSVAFAAQIPFHRVEIGWGASAFEPAADYMGRLAEHESIPRPLIANPDLGAVSWRKQFNVLDLGRLGSAVIPRVASPAMYVAAVAEPDIIELHAPWSCQYHGLLTAAGFDERYARVSPPDPGPAQCAGQTGARPTYWMRRAVMKGSHSSERAFLERFQRNLDVQLVERELSNCLATPGSRPCGYVGRTVFRFVPELKRAGRDQAIERLLLRDPRLRIEHAFFTSSRDPDWWRAVIEPEVQTQFAGLELQR